MTEVPDNILKRIQKLLSLAEGAKQVGSIHEAEVAAQKAQQLLFEYNLDIDTIKGTLEKEERMVGEERIQYGDKIVGKEGDWLKSLYHTIARHNLCKVIYLHLSRNKDEKWVALIGEKHNTEIVKYFIEYLTPQIRNLARKAFSEYFGEEKRGAFIRGFLVGCVRGIDDQLSGQLRQMADQNPKIDGLMRITDVNLAKYVANEYGRLKSSAPTRRSAQDGFGMGRQTGQGLSLNKGIKGGGNAFNRGLLN